MPNIKLQSSDGQTFEIDMEIVKCSVTIKNMLENLDLNEDEKEVVSLPNINSVILKKVIEYAIYHKDDPLPPEDDKNRSKVTDDISPWDVNFLKMDLDTFLKLTLAAHYFKIRGLIVVIAKTVANVIKSHIDKDF